MRKNEEQLSAPGSLNKGVPLSDSKPLLESFDNEQLQQVAVSQGIQALWQAVLPLIGIVPSRPGEYPGVFKVEPGPGRDEATVYIDVPAERYEAGKKPRLERVLALTVRLSHDYRLLGEQYYCVDCEPAAKNEAGH